MLEMVNGAKKLPHTQFHQDMIRDESRSILMLSIMFNFIIEFLNIKNMVYWTGDHLHNYTIIIMNKYLLSNT